jgi:hypothetical protein
MPPLISSDAEGSGQEDTREDARTESRRDKGSRNRKRHESDSDDEPPTSRPATKRQKSEQGTGRAAYRVLVAKSNVTGRVKPEPYTPGEDFVDFRRAFEMAAMANCWNEAAMKLKLVECFDADTKVLYRDILEDPTYARATFAQVADVMEQRFAGKANKYRETQRRLLAKMKMKDKEAIEALIVRFIGQARKAGITKDERLQEEFLRVLSSSLRKSVKQALIGKESTTWADLQEYARTAYDNEREEADSSAAEGRTEEESPGLASRQVAFRRTHAVTTGAESAARLESSRITEEIAMRAEAETTRLKQETEKLQKRIRELEAAHAESTPAETWRRPQRQREPPRFDSSRGPNAECFRCGVAGHFKRECTNTHVCKACNRTGHIDGWCEKRKAAQQQQRGGQSPRRDERSGTNREPLGWRAPSPPKN